MNLPNALTIIRIIISPLVFAALLAGGGWNVAALILFGTGSITDWLDGYLARRNKRVTGFGQFADPLADKLLSGFTMAAAAVTGYIWIWPVIGIVLRDILVTSFRLWAMDRGRKILPSKLAKAKTAVELASLTGILAYVALGGRQKPLLYANIAMVATFALAWITGIDYFLKNRSLLSGPEPPAVD